ncbi:hypothetical protein FNB79_14410 [Formosa sediminum]|uniref:Uncharacterized protein n=1 Tax=Formosa sediminum TaxID=2594004 RepID=A0A516GUB0_9FLAO|nr:hypothetical protein [Formosa sediminum]QDO95114.1 hypothetical protein FNB79_14410 [Formosa sediminum]
MLKYIIITTMLSVGSWSIYATATRFESSEKNLIIKTIQEEFKEIDIAILPNKVKDAVAKDFKNATICKAYINNVNEYKLKLKDNKTFKTLYITEDGVWINK